jgi:hypothetical protein
MSDDDKETSPTLDVAPIAVRGRVRHSGSFSKDNQPERRGRTAGSLNKITRTMKDAIIAAADDLDVSNTRTGPSSLRVSLKTA